MNNEDLNLDELTADLNAIGFAVLTFDDAFDDEPEDTTTVVKTAEAWQSVASKIARGQFHASTGSQQRASRALASFIGDIITGVDPDERVPIDLDWDSVLTVAQAS